MGLPSSSPLVSGGDAAQSIPLLAESTSCSDSDDGPVLRLVSAEGSCSGGDRERYRALTVLSGHVGSVSSLALCGEFILSALQGTDIVVWQQPDLRRFAQFGRGEGSVKALAVVGSRVLTAHQDGRIRVWKVSTRSENALRLVATLPTTRDYLGRFMKQSNYVQTRRHHRKLWIEHADSISCLAVGAGVVYSGSWDRTLKVWRLSDLWCIESIRAHDDAINACGNDAAAAVALLLLTTATKNPPRDEEFVVVVTDPVLRHASAARVEQAGHGNNDRRAVLHRR